MQGTIDNTNIPSKHINHKNDRMMLLTLLILAANLRGCITGVGSLVPLIRDDLGINNAVAGMITTLPLLVFIIVSPLAAGISRRFGLGQTLMVAYLLLLLGIILRSFFGIIGLFSGTAIMALGLGFGNVLTLSLIKLRFPNKVGFVTGAYSSIMVITAALSIGISVPVATGLGFGWSNALGMWFALAVISIFLWYGRMKNESSLLKKQVETSIDKSYDKIVYRIPLAWCFALFNGMQILLFYSINAWLPSILHSKGYSLEQSSAFALYFQLMNLPSTLGVPILCARRQNQRSLILICGGLLFTGLLIFSFVQGFFMIILSLTIASLGLGSAFAFVNIFVSIRVDNALQSAALSGMIQTMGYVVAAFAPTLMGFMYDLSHSWTSSYILLLIVALSWVLLGMPLASDRKFFQNY